jgi:plasmid maintenance system antidote protein VapI
MKDGAYYMKKIRDLPNVGSFNKAGLFLGISGAAVSSIRNGGGISEDTAMNIGKALGIEPGIIFADINEARAKDQVSRKFWHNISKQLGTAASIVFALPSLAMIIDNNHTANMVFHYILCKMMGFRKSAILSVSCPNYQSSFSVP